MSEELDNETITPAPVVPPPVPVRRVWRRRAQRTALVAGVALLLLAIAIFLFFRLGYVDSNIQTQIIARLAKSGLRAEIGTFRTSFGPRFELADVKLYDLQTNELLGTIKHVKGRLRITDLFALNLSRRLELQEMDVDGLEFWVRFDADGNSNIRNLRAGESTKRINFDFATGQIRLTNSIVHYGDARYDISANAKNLAVQVGPDDPSLPVEKRTFSVNLSSDGADFTYNDKKIEPVQLSVRARVNQQRTDIEELFLRSPFSETTLHGYIDDYQKLSYHLELDSSVDLQQAAEVIPTGAALRGTGNLSGTVTGEGANYQVSANFKIRRARRR